jgi:FixJ family two-component response regulator
MNSADPVIFVVDDDPSVRTALERLIKSVGFRAKTFDTARSFFDNAPGDAPCCLILDVRMPQMSGLELQEEMALKGLVMPIIFITGHGTVSMSVRAMKAGAMDFLEKPFEEQQLLDAIQAAVEKDRESKRKQAEIMQIKKRADSLTPREYEVFKLVVSGRLNKQIAYELAVSEKTVKVHRARVVDKMKAESLASLVRMAEKIGIFPVSD